MIQALSIYSLEKSTFKVLYNSKMIQALSIYHVLYKVMSKYMVQVLAYSLQKSTFKVLYNSKMLNSVPSASKLNEI